MVEVRCIGLTLDNKNIFIKYLVHTVWLLNYLDTVTLELFITSGGVEGAKLGLLYVLLITERKRKEVNYYRRVFFMFTVYMQDSLT